MPEWLIPGKRTARSLISCGVRTLHTGLRRSDIETHQREPAGCGIVILGTPLRGVAEEAPGAYKDVGAVVDAADRTGLSRKVARLEPRIAIKG